MGFSYRLDEIEMRQVYASTLLELASRNPDVIGLEADLMSAITTNKIAEKIPGRLINCGIMEANMIGVAAGLSLTGKVPYLHTFGQFATRRAYDQLFVSVNYAKLNVKVLGSDAGVTAEHNGGTHMVFEDLALLRPIPGATVLEASDAVLLEWLLRKVEKEYGFHYIRTIRKKAVQLYEKSELFEIGKGKILRDGYDVTIITSGIMAAEALQAADMLARENISAAVIDMFTIKPIDKKLIVQYAVKTNHIITAENHSITGGLGSAVAEVLSELRPTRIKRIGIKEQFGQVGQTDYLKQVYGLTKENIFKQAIELIEG